MSVPVVYSLHACLLETIRPCTHVFQRKIICLESDKCVYVQIGEEFSCKQSTPPPLFTLHIRPFYWAWNHRSIGCRAQLAGCKCDIVTEMKTHLLNVFWFSCQWSDSWGKLSWCLYHRSAAIGIITNQETSHQFVAFLRPHAILLTQDWPILSSVSLETNNTNDKPSVSLNQLNKCSSHKPSCKHDSDKKNLY